MFDKLKPFFIIILSLAILDFIFLSSISTFFKNMIYNIQKINFKPRLLSAFLCYLIIIFALYYFIILKNGNILDAFILGFCIYSIFELTNYTFLKNWSIYLVIMDSLWGGLLFATTIYIYKKLI